MANLEAEQLYPEQWAKMVEGGPKWKGWGQPEPKRVEMNGKTTGELQNWSSACKVKVAYWIGRIPEDQSKNDGFDEVRAAWFARRALFLSSEAERMEDLPTVRPSAIRPLLPEKFPFGGRPALCTKRQRQEEEQPIGSGEALEIRESVPTPSPPAIELPQSLKQPFKPPRKLAKSVEGEMNWLAEVPTPPSMTQPSLMSEEVLSDSDDDPLLHQAEEINAESEEE
jgi:hypothetical protein